MNVPVLWVSHHPDVLARGYFDQAVLEAVLDRSLWRPANAITYEHHVMGPEVVPGSGQDPDADAAEPCKWFSDIVDGAVVVFAARHHEGDEDWLIENLQGMAWAVVLMTSEEEWRFDWRRLYDALDPQRYRFWAWQPRPEHVGLSWLMPCGWYPNTREGLRSLTASVRAEERPLDWFFGGQVTHERRRECVQAIASAESRRHPHDSLLTEGYRQGIPFADYLTLEQGAKVIPCPSGPESCCTARVEEALEASSVPIVDMLKPKDPQFDYWRTLFGPNCPLRGINDWADWTTVLDEELAAWPMNGVRLSAWWQQWKRDTALQLDHDVRAVSGAGGGMQPGEDARPPAPDDLITVVIPTSPTLLHPATDHIAQTVESVRAQLPDAQIIICADGVREEQEHLADNYGEYLRRLVRLTEHHWHNVLPVVMDEFGHQANVTRLALRYVDTPQLLFVEHDTPLVGEIDWPGLCAYIASGEANCIRFHEDVAINEAHESGMLDHETRWCMPTEYSRDWYNDHVYGVPLRRTKTWWQRPHLASTRFYRQRVMPRFTPESRTMIEDLLYGEVSTDHIVNGDAAWWDWRLWVYTPDDPFDDPVLGIKRSSHLDSRGDEPKYDMKFK